jgi:hypothetical protein
MPLPVCHVACPKSLPLATQLACVDEQLRFTG